MIFLTRSCQPFPALTPHWPGPQPQSELPGAGTPALGAGAALRRKPRVTPTAPFSLLNPEAADGYSGLKVQRAEPKARDLAAGAPRLPGLGKTGGPGGRRAVGWVSGVSLWLRPAFSPSVQALLDVGISLVPTRAVWIHPHPCRFSVHLGGEQRTRSRNDHLLPAVHHANAPVSPRRPGVWSGHRS